jgi:poly(hydroxyalkanoate) depolymerase family esterase
VITRFPEQPAVRGGTASVRFRAVVAVLALVLTIPMAAAGLDEVESFGSNPGNLRMFVHLPNDLPRQAPLVAVAHACFQTAADVAAHSGWVEMADAYRFALLFPQTSTDNEPKGGCFRTWEPEHQHRDEGEPLSVRQMIVWLLEHHSLDRERVFITGMSSGGLLTNVMLATYPELFAGGAPQSAYPYNCATTFDELKACAEGRGDHTAAAWTGLVLAADPDYTGRRPRMSIWHGEADPLLLTVNLDLQLGQWAGVMGVDLTADEIDVIDGHTRKRYNGANGEPQIETYLIRGMGHAVAVDPDGTPACGEAAPFFVDADICAALWIARWFGLVP